MRGSKGVVKTMYSSNAFISRSINRPQKKIYKFHHIFQNLKSIFVAKKTFIEEIFFFHFIITSIVANDDDYKHLFFDILRC